MPRYILVGACPFRSYTGTATATALREVGRCDTREEAHALVKTHYEECGGLLVFVDSTPDLPQVDGIMA